MSSCVHAESAGNGPPCCVRRVNGVRSNAMLRVAVSAPSWAPQLARRHNVTRAADCIATLITTHKNRLFKNLG